MISPRQRAESRRLFYAEHWPVGTIADALGVHHLTVTRALNRAYARHPGPQMRPSALDPYRAFITATLEQYPRLRATRLWAMLRDRGYPGSAVRRAHSLPPAPARAPPHADPASPDDGGPAHRRRQPATHGAGSSVPRLKSKCCRVRWRL